MGRYVSFGIVRTYCFFKKSIRDYVNDWFNLRLNLKEEDVKNALVEQMFPDIYEFIETDDSYEFTLKNDLSVNDIVELLSRFWDVAHIPESERKRICETISEMTLNDALDLAEEKKFCKYQDFHLYGRFYGGSPFAYPLTVNGKQIYMAAEVFGVMIGQSDSKTISESDIRPYDFFTELLRYRLKPCRLADSALVFLSGSPLLASLRHSRNFALDSGSNSGARK